MNLSPEGRAMVSALKDMYQDPYVLYKDRIPKLIDLMMHMLRRKDDSTMIDRFLDYPLIRFMVFTTLNPHNQFKKTDLITKDIAILEYWSRMAILYKVANEQADDETDKRIDDALSLVGPGTLFAFMFRMKGDGLLFQKTDGLISEVNWTQDGLDSSSFSKITTLNGVFDISKFSQEMIPDMIEECAKDIDELTFGHQRAMYLDLKKMKDQVNNREHGYSMFSDTRNRELHEIRSEVIEIGIEKLMEPDGQSDFDMGFKAVAWLQKCEQLCKKLLVLYHLTAGQPGRGTEVQRLQFQNLLDRVRNLYLTGDGEMFTLSYYNKTDSMTGTRKNIFRYIHSSVAQLLGRFYGFVRPLEEYVISFLFST